MKKLIFLFTFLIFLSACSSDNNEPMVNNYYNYENTSLYNDADGYIDDSSVDEDNKSVENLEPNEILKIFNNTFIDVNVVTIENIVSGEIFASYEFGEYEIVRQVWDLSGGYFLALVGEEDGWLRESRLRWLEDEFAEVVDIEFDDRTPFERNFRLVLFDNSLNILNTFDDAQLVEFTSDFFAGIIQKINNEIIMYNWSLSYEAPWDLVVYNVATNTFTRTIQSDNPLPIRNLMNNTDILIAGNLNSGSVESSPLFAFGVLNNTSGSSQVTEISIENFLLQGVQVFENNVLLTEGSGRFSTPSNYVIVGNLTDLTYISVPLRESESRWATLSTDENNILSINHELSELVVTNFDGVILNTFNFEIPNNANIFEIFAIDENEIVIYVEVLHGVRNRISVSIE